MSIYGYIAWLIYVFIGATDKLGIHMGVVYYCENAHLLRHRSERTSASAYCYQVDSETKALHYKGKYAINLKLDPTLLDVGDMILVSNFPRPWILVCMEKHHFYNVTHIQGWYHHW